MKTTRLLAVLSLSAALAACGNDGLLSALTGANDGLSAQEQACEDLPENVCEECHAPDGTAGELFVDVTPEAYDGGPLELAIVVGSPAGLRLEDGSWRVAITYSINDTDLFAAIPAEAWQFSEDGTKGRVVLFKEAGLPAGEYQVNASITDGEAAADDTENYVVHHEEAEPTPHEPDATPTPHEPDATPTE